MDESHLTLHERTLHVLIGKLEIANAMLKRLVEIKPPENAEASGSDIVYVPKKLKYAFKRDSLDEAIEAIESWQKISDPGWFLVLRMTDHQLDTELARDSSQVPTVIPSTLSIRAAKDSLSVMGSTTGKGQNLPVKHFREMTVSDVPLSAVKTAQKAGSQLYILDSVLSLEPASYYAVKQDIRDLARRLQHTEPQNFGLFSCKGFVAEKAGGMDGAPTIFSILFRVPQGFLNPRSLRDYLVNTRSIGSLSHKFEIARQLANSICYVHTFGFIHKNIRPETILGLMSSSSSCPSVFLVGFDNFRKEEGKTRRAGDESFEKNLYRHPSRQGMSPGCDYLMQHDIYSLGVCLLEIGLWSSFVEYDSVTNSPRPSALLAMPENPTSGQANGYLLTSAKDDFLNLARTRLPEHMGTKYANVVETCLTCLDPGNEDFGDQAEFEDEDGIRVGVRYIEKVSIFQYISCCITSHSR
jgi:hypothetical protein